LPWKLVAIALACIAVIAVVAVLRPWEKPVVEEEGISPPAAEFVEVRYLADFLLTTHDGGPVENLKVVLQYPYVRPGLQPSENEPWPEYWLGEPYLENFDIRLISINVEREEMPVFTPYRYPGDNWIAVTRAIVSENDTVYIPVLNFTVSELYSGELVGVEAWVRVSAENFENLTLLYPSENFAVAQIEDGFLPENRAITKLAIRIETQRKMDGVLSPIEIRERSLDNIVIFGKTQLVAIRLY
jgi:hypothetical protein